MICSSSTSSLFESLNIFQEKQNITIGRTKCLLPGGFWQRFRVCVQWLQFLQYEMSRERHITETAMQIDMSNE